ncbi:hypothetical protein MHLP_03260 [Candidatus Mycoplasma haematolamae str. Purdue]|uniref:Uncharacterized protein n=1 Tax=Mycoplasma haematolamae (strain Purdue) TaxID=1212765 RepID=I7C6S1_MYCHA|nr:hypothetical protein MHLP_03260 [Candidatus Mycoplasma haematolamae str. Purdue]
MKTGKQVASNEKEFWSNYQAFTEALIEGLTALQERTKKDIEVQTQATQETVSKINNLNEEIVKAGKDWEKLKGQFRVFKAYESRVSNNLCSLLTVKKTDCVSIDQGESVEAL